MVAGRMDIAREETCCCHMVYSFQLAASVLLHAPFHRQDSTYHCLCYTRHGALVGMRNSSMGPPWRIDPTTYRTKRECSYQGTTSHWPGTSSHCILEAPWFKARLWLPGTLSRSVILKTWFRSLEYITVMAHTHE